MGGLVSELASARDCCYVLDVDISITSTNEVPLKETIITPVITQSLALKVYNRKPKASRSVGSSSNAKIIESKTSNTKEPKQSWGSTVSDVPYFSLNDYRFKNDHIAKIMGHGDYQMGNVTISLVYYMEGLGHNLFSVGQSCDSDLKVAFRKHTCFIRDLDGVDLLKGSRGSNFALCYPTKDDEDLGKLKPKVDIGIFLTTMAFEQFSSRLGPKLLTLGTISLGLVQNIPTSTSYVPPTKNDWEILFQPMFDEYLNPPPCVDPQVPAVIAPDAAVSTGTPSSTTINQDAPSTITSQTNQETPTPVIPHGVEEADHDIEVAHMDNDPYVDFPIPEPSSKESSTQIVIPNNVYSINQPPEHINKWTKDHLIDNVIGDPSRPVFTRHQLQDEALFCYFDAFLFFIEPKSYKEALTKSCWIESMQEELNEFKHLKV
ncbi:hypothetical protein Tco_0157336 [Tanacetum coccineum]